MKLILEIEPVPKSRPRVNTKTRGRYLPKKCKEYQSELEWQIRGKYRGTPKSEPLRVRLKFYRPLKVLASKYGDVDNLAKAVLDAANGILWKDDRQIVSLLIEKYEGDGRIEMEVE